LAESQPTDKAKGDVLELVAKAYLICNPTYRALLDDVWRLSEVPTDVEIPGFSGHPGLALVSGFELLGDDTAQMAMSA
jgi:predicted helicase